MIKRRPPLALSRNIGANEPRDGDDVPEAEIILLTTIYKNLRYESTFGDKRPQVRP